MNELKPCHKCGMGIAADEFHPYAACLMFRACHNGFIVRANLKDVRRSVLASQPEIEVVSKNAERYLRVRNATEEKA